MLTRNITKEKTISPYEKDTADCLSSIESDRANCRTCPSSRKTSLDVTEMNMNELILINLFNQQNSISNYQSGIATENIYYQSRKNILSWLDNVLNSTDLKEETKDSIYHRFCYAYSIIFGELFINEIYLAKGELKLFLISLFLIVYKMEGFTISKLTIKNIMKLVHKKEKGDSNRVEKQIEENEITLLSLLDYDLFTLESNMHQMTKIVMSVLSEKYPELKKKENVINEYLRTSNRNIENSNEPNILFDMSPIEKSLISILSVLVGMENSVNMCNKYVHYLKEELGVISMGTEEVVKYSKMYSQKLYILKQKRK